MTVLAEKQTIRWLAISFAVLASLCLIAAFCTSERGQNTGQFYAFADQEPVHQVPEHLVRQMPENLRELEKEIWTLAGYDFSEMESCRETEEDQLWESAGIMTRVMYTNDKGMDRYCTFAEDGTLLELQELNTPWLGEELNESSKYVGDDAALQEISDRLMVFLERVNPGMSQTIDHLRVEWENELDGQIWMQIEGIPADQDYGEWITFVVRMEPEWQLQYFACISNG